MQKDSNARYMRNKSWPQFEDWKEVFGQDRADGVKCVDLGDSVRTIYGNKFDLPDDAGTSHTITLEELFPDEVFPPGILPEMIDESQSATEGDGAVAGAGEVAGAGSNSGAGSGSNSGAGVGAGSGSGAGTVAGSGSRPAGSGAGARAATVAAPKVSKKVVRKRKMDDKLDGVLALMSQIHTDTNDRLKEISSRIGYDFDLSTKRTEVFEQLKGIPGLTLKQQFYISKKLVKEPELMDLFRGLPEIARGAFVFDLLEIDQML